MLSSECDDAINVVSSECDDAINVVLSECENCKQILLKTTVFPLMEVLYLFYGALMGVLYYLLQQ